MFVTNSLEFLSVGVAIAATLVLCFAVIFNNWKKITARAFLYFSAAAIVWGMLNYFSYGIRPVSVSLMALRDALFLGVWLSFLFFRLAYVFPEREAAFPRWYRDALLPVVILASLLALTPMVLSQVTDVDQSGMITGIEGGPACVFFVAVVLGLLLSGMGILLKGLMKSKGVLRRQFCWIFSGAILSFTLVALFNFILPIFYGVSGFVSLDAVFLFPFIAMAANGILKYHLSDMNVIGAEVLAALLAAITLSEVITADSPVAVIYRSAVFLLVAILGTLLVRSARVEAKRKQELAELNSQFERANSELGELNRFKTQLLSIASHQVKSPLAAIAGFVSAAAKGLHGPVDPKAKDILEKVENSAEGLVEIMNNVLDVRKIEDGRMDYHFAKTDIARLIKGVISEFHPIADSKKVSLSFYGPESGVFLNADEEKVKQVVKNIIGNAIKYTSKGFVKVELWEKGREVEFSVSDSGIGMPKELVPHIFKKFVRDDRIRAKIMGTGLGLFIAKNIIAAHGGRIKAESKGLHMGSRFSVTLPVA